MLFVQKGRNPRLVPGFGVIDRFEILTIQEAWVRWGLRNGVASLGEFTEQVTRVAESTSTNGGGLANRMEGDNTRIGCVILRKVFLLPDSAVPNLDAVLPDFPSNVVSYKRYDKELPELFRTPLEVAAARETGEMHGTVADPEERSAIERHAMRMCEVLFPRATIVDVSRPESAVAYLGVSFPGYDIWIRNEHQAEFHLEVKGTKLDNPVVEVTHNELNTACRDPRARLLVVHGIRTYRDDTGWHALGGTPALFQWKNTDKIRSIIDALSELHQLGLGLNAPEWSLAVHKSDFVIG